MELSNEDKLKLEDKTWRMSHLYKIRNKHEETVTFKPNKAQQHFTENKWFRNIILKSRQLGFTTYEAIDLLDDALFNPNYSGVLLAHTKDDAIEIFKSKILFAWENFPFKELYDLQTDRANELKFGFGDGTYSSCRVATSARSGTYNRVHQSELGKLAKKFPEKALEFVRGTIPSVSQSGRIDVESTAEGAYGEFFDLYQEAKETPVLPTEFKAHFYNWTWDTAEIEKVTPEQMAYISKEPDFKYFKGEVDSDPKKYSDIEWAYYYLIWSSMRKDFDALKQEYPCTAEEAFSFSGSRHFPTAILDKYETRGGVEEGSLTIYEDYKTNGHYLIGADIAGGIGRDHSTMVVLKVTTPADPIEVVAIYKDNKIDPTLFAHELRSVAIRYGGALICPEANNHGHETLAKLITIYPNVYRHWVKDALDPRRKRKIYGWLTTGANKGTLLGELKEAITNGILYIPSKPLINELKNYDREDIAEVKNETGHWDLVIALGIAYQMVVKVPPPEEKGGMFEPDAMDVFVPEFNI